LRAKAAEGLCCVILSCPNKGVVNGRRVIPACEAHRQTWLRQKLRLRHPKLNPASRRPREGWGVDISNPDEMAACLSMVPVPSAIIDLVRKIEHVNQKGSDFYIDFEFASLPRPRKEGEVVAERIPVEIAVLRLDGQIVIDTPIKYSQSIPELLAGVPRTGPQANFTWGVMRSTYGQDEETWGKTWDEVRQILLDAGMNRNNYLVEWSNNRIDYSLLKMIMEEHSPSNSILLIPYWKAILPGFSSMSLSYFHPFICPGSKLHEHAHQAGFDSFMLVDGMRTMIDLAHRDDPQVEDQVVNELRTDEQILQSQEQLKKEYDDDDYDDDQTWDDIDSLDIQVADKEAMDVMTNEEKELVDLFQKSLGTLPSADETSSPTSIPSVRGNEDYKVKSEIDEEEDGL
jgi:hypothetical protein